MPDSDQAQTPDAPERVDEVTRALTDLSLLLDAEEELIRVLQRGVDQATWAIPSADLVSVTVVRDDRAETIAANDERVRAIDSQQYAAGEGPYLEAARSSETVRANVERATALWPKFARIARGAGMASFLSSPLIIADKFAGSLNRTALSRTASATWTRLCCGFTPRPRPPPSPMPGGTPKRGGWPSTWSGRWIRARWSTRRAAC